MIVNQILSDSDSDQPIKIFWQTFKNKETKSDCSVVNQTSRLAPMVNRL